MKKSDWDFLAALLGGQPPSEGRSDQPFNNILRDLFSPRPQQPPGGMFGQSWPPPANRPTASRTPSAQGLKRRSTFYSFHYADVFRVNHVRKSGVLRSTDCERTPTPQDRSLWEKARNTNPNALKMMIARALAGTTVTCVLAGEQTWQRPWVRYEIARSLLKGNGLLTVHIDGCQCPKSGFGRRGPNPLSFVALGFDRRIYERDADGNWILFDKINMKLATWPKWLPRVKPGYVSPLDTGAGEYDWIADDGRRNLSDWTNTAAESAGG